MLLVGRREGMKCAASGNRRTSWVGFRFLAVALNDDDIAVKLDLPEVKVQGCIAWIVHFLELKNRQGLIG